MSPELGPRLANYGFCATNFGQLRPNQGKLRSSLTCSGQSWPVDSWKSNLAWGAAGDAADDAAEDAAEDAADDAADETADDAAGHAAGDAANDAAGEAAAMGLKPPLSVSDHLLGSCGPDSTKRWRFLSMFVQL